MTSPSPDPAAAELERLHAIEAAATKGAWKIGHGASLTGVHGDAKLSGYVAETFGNRADTEFIVTARTAFPRLLAAVEDVLKLHQPELVDGRNADGDEFDSYECMACDTGGVRDNWPCDTYRAITRSLTGKGGSDE